MIDSDVETMTNRRAGPPAVVVVGRISLDIYVEPEAGMPAPGAEELCRFAYHVGGTAANTAVDLALLGLSVDLQGLVGNDPFGVWLRTELQSAGVNIEAVGVTDAAPTSVTLVFRDESGESSFLKQPGANEHVGPDSLPAENTKASVLHIGGLLGLPGIEGSDTAWLQRLKGQVVLSADTTRTIERASAIEPFLPLLDLLFLNQMEGEAVSGSHDPDDIVRQICARGPSRVVLKIGSGGCIVGDEAGVRHFPAFQVPAVDTTGAGDAFVAGFLVGVVRDWTLEDCARLANAAGAATIAKRGATSGVADAWRLMRS